MNETRKKRGLTLLEILLVVSLMSVMALTLYNALSNGLRVWYRVQNFLLEEDIALFFENITEELHNVVSFQSMPFLGDETSLSFPTVVQVLEDPKIHPGQVNYVNQIGRVRYFFDSLDQNLYRQDSNYSLMLQYKFFNRQPVARSLKNVTFVYYSMQEGEMKRLTETQAWPVMIRIAVHYEDATGQEHVMEKSVVLPIYSIGNV